MVQCGSSSQFPVFPVSHIAEEVAKWALIRIAAIHTPQRWPGTVKFKNRRARVYRYNYLDRSETIVEITG